MREKEHIISIMPEKGQEYVNAKRDVANVTQRKHKKRGRAETAKKGKCAQSGKMTYQCKAANGQIGEQR